MAKVKINEVGQPCRHCETQVERRSHKTRPKYKADGYWFEWWLFCPKCRALYMQESAKRWFDAAPPKPISKFFAARAKGQEIVDSNIATMLKRNQGSGDDPNELP